MDELKIMIVIFNKGMGDGNYKKKFERVFL